MEWNEAGHRMSMSRCEVDGNIVVFDVLIHTGRANTAGEPRMELTIRSTPGRTNLVISSGDLRKIIC